MAPVETEFYDLVRQVPLSPGVKALMGETWFHLAVAISLTGW